jgi:hypothetical protein
MPDIERDLGRLESRQEAHDKRLERIEIKVDQLLEYVAKNKGGIRVLLAVGSVAASIGAVIAEIANKWHGSP